MIPIILAAEATLITITLYSILSSVEKIISAKKIARINAINKQ